jgi:hypothetical protein
MQYNYENDDPASRFEFREEYWEQAKALIEADEARRRRRRWLLWWFFAGLLLVVAGWWWASPGQLLSKKEEKLEKIEVQSPKIDIKTHLDRNISNEESTQLPSNTEKTTSNRAGSNSSEINTNTTASSGAKHSAFSPKATHQTNSFTETDLCSRHENKHRSRGKFVAPRPSSQGRKMDGAVVFIAPSFFNQHPKDTGNRVEKSRRKHANGGANQAGQTRVFFCRTTIGRICLSASSKRKVSGLQHRGVRRLSGKKQLESFRWGKPSLSAGQLG